MPNFTVLNIGVDSMEREVGYVNLCTKEVFDQSIADFPSDVRWEAANLAAHGWDVILFKPESTFGHCIFIGSSHQKRGTFYKVSGKEFQANRGRLEIFYSSGGLDLSSLNPDGKRFMINHFALRQFAAAIRYVDFVDGDVFGEKMDAERQFKKKKRMLQNFWNQLSSYP